MLISPNAPCVIRAVLLLELRSRGFGLGGLPCPDPTTLKFPYTVLTRATSLRAGPATWVITPPPTVGEESAMFAVTAPAVDAQRSELAIAPAIKALLYILLIIELTPSAFLKPLITPRRLE